MDRDETFGAIEKDRALLGTSLFARSQHDDEHRLIVSRSYWRWVRNRTAMTIGFQRAGRVLADHLQSDDVEFDFLFVPFVYLYRHALELRLKLLKRDAEGYLGHRPGVSKPSHRLVELWDEIAPLLSQCGVATNAETQSAIRQRIQEFEQLDPGGTAFRYPDAAQAFGSDTVLGVSNLADILDALLEWLDAYSTEVDELSQAEADLQEPEDDGVDA